MFHTLYHQAPQPNTADSHTPPQGVWPASFLGTVALPKVMTSLTNQWTLNLTGQLAEDRQLTWADLMALPKVSQQRRVISAEGWSYRSLWTGIPLGELLRVVQPESTEVYLTQENASGHVESMMLADALHGEPLLVFEENHQPLSPWHGGPLRLVVFDRFLHKGLGQLTALRFEKEPSVGHWETMGYEATGRITPGHYYAFDLKAYRPIEKPAEVTAY